MKKKNLLTLLLLFAMSFQVLHAYVIDALDTHACDVSEYIVEFDAALDKNNFKGDICQIHHAFHIPFILLEHALIKKEKLNSQKPHSSIKFYDYNSYDNFLKPPITL